MQPKQKDMKNKKPILKILKWIGISIPIIVAIFVSVLAVNVDFSSPSDLQTFIENKINKAGIAGVSIAMIKNGEVVSTWQAGYTDIENKKLVTEDTVFQVASISKVVTGIAIMQLYERGLIDLDDNINKYLSFKIVHPKYPEVPITFRELLSHTAGLKENWDVIIGSYNINSGGGDSNVSLEEFVKEYFVNGGKWYDAEKNFGDIPGKKWDYSNAGYGLLGYMVEEISGLSFPEYCKKNIFIPLEMNHTTWLLKDTGIENLAIPYEGKKGLPHYSFHTYPDGALKTTTTEYAHILIAMMNGGKYKNNSILKPETVKEMTAPFAKEGLQALTWNYDSLEEMQLKDLNNGKVIGHTGGNPGVLSFALFNPENNTGIVFVMNQGLEMNLRIINFGMLIRRLVLEAGLV